MIHIEKSFVHKVKEENVLISNLRRKLPRRIGKEVFEQHLLTDILEKKRGDIKDEFIRKNMSFIFGNDDINCLNKEIFLFHYSKVKKKFEDIYDTAVFQSMKEKEKDFLFAYYQHEGDFYVYHEAPSRIRKDEYENILHQLNPEQSDFLNSLYSPDGKDEVYFLHEDISEIEESGLIEILRERNLWINDHDRTHLSDILDNCKDIPRENDFYANIIINTQHPFFFEHPNEHVPGMLMVEGVRQFLLACSHKYGNVPLEGVTCILQDFTINFTEYVELYSPVLVRAVGKNVQYSKHGYWSYIDMDIEIYQNNKRKGTMKVKASSLPVKLFKRFRNPGGIAESRKRYIPREESRLQVVLNIHGNPVVCKLKDVSCFDFALEFPADVHIENDSCFDFYMFLDHAGFIHGQCHCRRIAHDTVHDVDVAGFTITPVSESDALSMADLIKRYCLVNRDREIYEKKRQFRKLGKTEEIYAARS